MKTITRSQIELAKPESEWVRYEDAAEEMAILKDEIKELEDSERELSQKLVKEQTSHVKTHSHFSMLLNGKDEQIKELKEFATQHKLDCQIVSSGFLISEDKRVCTCGFDKLNKH
jgi:hypothetical protein